MAASAGIATVCAEEVDRVLAAVNGKIITASDLKIARDLNSLLVLGKESESTGTAEDKELDRLVDLELIRQELENFRLAPDDQSSVDSEIADLKLAYAEIGGLAALMSRLGLQEEELYNYIQLKASILRFVRLRFRPFVSVSQTEIQSYYETEFLPALKKAAAPVPPPAEVSPKIEEIIAARKVNSSMDLWIRDLRSHSRIEMFPSRSGLQPGNAGEVKDQDGASARGRVQF